MRHLVTGGSGFLGDLICRHLFSEGYEVINGDIWHDSTQPSQIIFRQCDVTDRQQVRAAMQGVDVVHHNAALVPLTKSSNRFWDVNVRGSQIVAEEAKRAGVKYFIHMSSSAIFGLPKECPITHETPTSPIEIYGRGKLAGELAVKHSLENSDTKLIIIRPRTILGGSRLGIFQVLFEWIKENRNVYVIGSGNVNFQFIHAVDLMDFYMRAMKMGHAGTYNVGTDRFGTLREALEGVILHAGSKSKVVSLPERFSISALKTLDFFKLSPLAPWHYLTYHKAFYFDVSPLFNLGWKAQYSNDEMFKESYDFFLKSDCGVSKQLLAQSIHRKPVKQRILKILKKFS